MELGKAMERRKVALITGAGTGIGKVLAMFLAENGYDIGLNYFSSEKTAHETAEYIRSIGGKVLLIKADVSDCAQIERMFSEVEKQFGGIDLFVNNSGITKREDFYNITEDCYDLVMDINLKGAVFCVNAAYKNMLKYKKAGTIVVISSNHQKLYGMGDNIAYALSKVGLKRLVEGLAIRMAVDNINIVDIAPGWVMVDRYSEYSDEYKEHINNTIPIGRMAQSREVGRLILTLASESGKAITGTTIFMDGALSLTCNNFDRRAAQERLESAKERQDR